MKLDILTIAFTAYYHLKKALLLYSDPEVITFFFLEARQIYISIPLSLDVYIN
jgi:hypothetical protein